VRRKVLQHFANMLPQRFLDLPSGFDLAVFANHQKGYALFNVLTGEASIDGAPNVDLRTANEYRAWLEREMVAHRIAQDAFLKAELGISFVVENVQLKESYGNVFRSAQFSFRCESTFHTDEAEYECRRSDVKTWGFDPPYWTQLYGSEKAEA
jgi:hypothetical protein